MAHHMFSFGENWLAFAADLTPERIVAAERDLIRLMPSADLSGRRFLDIGSGSGLSSLVARQLGAAVYSFDVDEQSVACTRALRNRFRPDDPEWTITSGSILEPGHIENLGQFDVVYSWGVLHHTGSMEQAIKNAARLVAPGGILALALYRKTRLCRAWALEKRWYSQASPRAQRIAARVYVTLFAAALRLRGQRLEDRARTYHENRRGMDFYRDVHDWLGGYPYESIAPSELDALLRPLGLILSKSSTRPMSLGLFGSGCDEFVYNRDG